MKKGVLLVFLLFLGFHAAWSQTPLEEGEDFFAWDKPEEARVKFEEALLRDSKNEKIYYYLGIVYEQLKKPAKAIEILQRGLPVATSLKPIMLYQIAKYYQVLRDNNLAEKYYTLALEESGVFADAYLNRANTRMDLVRYKEAVEDYKSYLRLKPDSSQRREIEKLIALLEQGFADQDALLQSVLDSLKNASTDTQTDSAGTDDYKDSGTTDVDIID